MLSVMDRQQALEQEVEFLRKLVTSQNEMIGKQQEMIGKLHAECMAQALQPAPVGIPYPVPVPMPAAQQTGRPICLRVAVSLEVRAGRHEINQRGRRQRRREGCLQGVP